MGAPLAHRIGVYSRQPALRKLDKRTREAGYMAWVRADLIAHVGGNPTVVQKMLIDRAAILQPPFGYGRRQDHRGPADPAG